MKKFVLGVALIGVFSLSSFNKVIENVKTSELIKTIDCKWRTGVLVGGVWHWSEWTYGDCNVTQSGQLVPIQ